MRLKVLPNTHKDPQMRVFNELRTLIFEYNVEWLSANSGVTDATIYNWLSGKTKKPRMDTVTKVANAIGWDVQLVLVQKVSKGRRKYLQAVS